MGGLCVRSPWVLATSEGNRQETSSQCRNSVLVLLNLLRNSWLMDLETDPTKVRGLSFNLSQL